MRRHITHKTTRQVNRRDADHFLRANVATLMSSTRCFVTCWNRWKRRRLSQRTHTLWTPEIRSVLGITFTRPMTPTCSFSSSLKLRIRQQNEFTDDHSKSCQVWSYKDSSQTHGPVTSVYLFLPPVAWTHLHATVARQIKSMSAVLRVSLPLSN